MENSPHGSQFRIATKTKLAKFRIRKTIFGSQDAFLSWRKTFSLLASN
jgi:hypothetical protein